MTSQSVCTYFVKRILYNTADTAEVVEWKAIKLRECWIICSKMKKAEQMECVTLLNSEDNSIFKARQCNLQNSSEWATAESMFAPPCIIRLGNILNVTARQQHMSSMRQWKAE